MGAIGSALVIALLAGYVWQAGGWRDWSVLVNLIWLPLPATLAWLPVLLFVKILVCFLVPD